MDAQGEDLYIAALPSDRNVELIGRHLVSFKAGQRPDSFLCSYNQKYYENIEYYYVLVWRFDLKEGEERPGWEPVVEYFDDYEEPDYGCEYEEPDYGSEYSDSFYDI